MSYSVFEARAHEFAGVLMHLQEEGLVLTAFDVEVALQALDLRLRDITPPGLPYEQSSFFLDELGATVLIVITSGYAAGLARPERRPRYRQRSRPAQDWRRPCRQTRMSPDAFSRAVGDRRGPGPEYEGDVSSPSPRDRARSLVARINELSAQRARRDFVARELPRFLADADLVVVNKPLVVVREHTRMNSISDYFELSPKTGGAAAPFAVLTLRWSHLRADYLKPPFAQLLLMDQG
jgi:hypothetical protein